MAKKEDNMNLKIEYVKVNEINEYENNARKHEEHDVHAIAKSIEQFGFSDPIGVWGKANTIVEGHGRYLAALELGLDEVPVIRLDHLSDEERRAYALAHNKTAELSEWDFGKLEEELNELEGIIDMTDFGWSGFELDMIGSGDVTPDEYDDDIGEYDNHEEDYLKKKRVIITYSEETEQDVRRLLNFEPGEKMKVVYDIKEIVL